MSAFKHALIGFAVRELQCSSYVDDVSNPHMRGGAHMFHHRVWNVRTSAVWFLGTWGRARHNVSGFRQWADDCVAHRMLCLLLLFGTGFVNYNVKYDGGRILSSFDFLCKQNSRYLLVSFCHCWCHWSHSPLTK
jgi:hypothetical protein